MAICTVAAISRPRALLALRCPDGRYAVLRYDASWNPSLGGSVEGEFAQVGATDIRLEDGSLRTVVVESINCSADFARARLTS